MVPARSAVGGVAACVTVQVRRFRGEEPRSVPAVLAIPTVRAWTFGRLHAPSRRCSIGSRSRSLPPNVDHHDDYVAAHPCKEGKPQQNVLILREKKAGRSGIVRHVRLSARELIRGDVMNINTSDPYSMSKCSAEEIM